jgi:hypothetical protein
MACFDVLNRHLHFLSFSARVRIMSFLESGFILNASANLNQVLSEIWASTYIRMSESEAMISLRAHWASCFLM